VSAQSPPVPGTAAAFLRPDGPGAVPAPAAPRRAGAVAAGGAAGPDRGGPLLPPLAARLVAFLALGAFAAQAWSVMVQPDAAGRLLAAVALAGLVAGGLVALHERGTPPGPARRAALLALGAGGLAGALLLAGVPARLLDPDGWGELARGLGSGIWATPGLSIPYRGPDEWNRITLLLGGTALVVGAAALAFWPRRGGRVGAPLAAAVALTVLYAVPAVQLRHDAPFVAGAVFMVLLGAFLWLERLARREAPLAAVALVAAAVAGLALAPRLDGLDPWIDYEGFAERLSEGGTTAFSWDHRYGPLNWGRDGREVLRVSARRPDYWKAAALTEFDGVFWTAGDPDRFALEPEALRRLEGGGDELRVTIGNLRSASFIAPGTTLEVRRSPREVTETALGTYAVEGRPLRRGHAYLARAYSPNPSQRELAAADGDEYSDLAWVPYLSMRLPPGVGGPPAVDPRTGVPVQRGGRPVTVQFAPWATGQAHTSSNGVTTRFDGEQLVGASAYGRTFALAQRLAGRSATPFEFVRAVQAHLARGYAYTEAPPPPGPGRAPLDTFLFRDRQGYCQHFSGAMALLLRMGGVPARVAAGFTPGSRAGGRDEYVVRDVDAHSWVEVYFAGVGWVTFDPTPAVAPPRAQDPGIAAGLLRDPSGDADATAGGERGSGIPSLDAGSVPAGDGSPVRTIALVALGLLAAGGAAALLAARKARRRRAAGGVEAAVAELERALRRAGRPLRPGDTLSGLERDLRGAPDAAGYVGALRRARFGWDPVARPSASERRALRRELALGGGRLGRLRALWALPPW
jgi:transglutaminase-like putative cysteine protease